MDIDKYEKEKDYHKQVRRYYKGLIKPFDAESAARYINWYDLLIKKALLIICAVFLYDYPAIAALGYTITGIIDCVVFCRNLTGVCFLSFLRFLEAFGFTFMYFCPIIFYLKQIEYSWVTDIVDDRFETVLAYVYVGVV